MSRFFVTSPSAWSAAGWTMLHVAWIAGVIGLFAALTRCLLRTARPEIRYSLALTLLAIMALAPALVFWAIFEPGPRPFRLAITSAGHTSVASLPRGERSSPVAIPFPVRDHPVVSTPASGLELLVPYLPWIWLIGSLSTLSLIGTGLAGVWNLRRRSCPLDEGEIARRCRVLSGSLGIAGHVAVGVCDRLVSPVLVGVFRPLILLPPAALGGWSMAQVEMVLLHELAHLRRRDNLANLGQTVAEAILFFHPAAWWVSAWARLERESCCDRLVVDRVKEPRAYAEMLVGLAGLRRESRIAAMAMARNQVVVRIGRILNREDRSMKLSMPEGLGVMGAVVVAASLALGMAMGSHAAPPNDPVEAKKALLRKTVEAVDAMKATGLVQENKADTLQSIARSQIKLGDHGSASISLKKAMATIDLSRLNNLTNYAERLSTIAQIAELQQEAGDESAASKTLDLLTATLDRIPVKPDKKSKIEPGDAEQAGLFVVTEESDAFMQVELYGALIGARIKMKQFDEARRLIDRTSLMLNDEPIWARGLYVGYLGLMMSKAGDPAAGRELIARARKEVGEIKNPDEKTAATSHLADVMAQAGDIDGALDLALSLNGPRKVMAVREIIETFAEYDGSGPSFTPGVVDIKIGADAFTVANRDAAIHGLPRIEKRLIEQSDDALLLVRSLWLIAHLQAKAGDFPGAWETALNIPAIKRKDFPKPNDGEYDAIQPATFALIAREQAKAGDLASASGKFRVAVRMGRAIEDEHQKIVALIVIARETVRVGDKTGSLYQEIRDLALKQAEPLRSRTLAAVAMGQVNAGDPAAAEVTSKLIRSYPIGEKLLAWKVLANAYEKAGDLAKAKVIACKTIELLEAKPPADAKLGPMSKLNAFGKDTYVDPELEFPPSMASMGASGGTVALRAQIDGIDEALKSIRDMPEDKPVPHRGVLFSGKKAAYTSLVCSLAYKGDLAGVERVIATIESPELRLAILTQLAYTLGQ